MKEPLAPGAGKERSRRAWSPGETVLAWFEPDLDERLHYAAAWSS